MRAKDEAALRGMRRFAELSMHTMGSYSGKQAKSMLQGVLREIGRRLVNRDVQTKVPILAILDSCIC